MYKVKPMLTILLMYLNVAPACKSSLSRVKMLLASGVMGSILKVVILSMYELSQHIYLPSH